MCLQILHEEQRDTSSGTIATVFSSTASAMGLQKTVEGHVVGGHSLMPLAVFCDMALTSARHCFFRIDDTNPAAEQMTLHDIAINKAVSFTSESAPTVLTTATYSKAAGFVDVAFHLSDGTIDLKKCSSIGTCKVKLLGTVGQSDL